MFGLTCLEAKGILASMIAAVSWIGRERSAWAQWCGACVSWGAAFLLGFAACGDAAVPGVLAGEDVDARPGDGVVGDAGEGRGADAHAGLDGEGGTTDGAAQGTVDVLGALQDGGGDVGNDDDGPIMTVLAPKGGVALTGSVLVHVLAEDPSGVELLRVGVGGALLADTNPLPGVFIGSWDSVAAGDGEHTLVIEARDVRGNATWVDVGVLVQNGPGRLVTGVVSTGVPIVGAAVALRDWNDGLPGGELLASAVTDAIGRFTATTLKAAPTGWGIVEVGGPGGTVTDPASGSQKALKADDVLWSVVRLDDALGAVVTRVNAWTTLSAGLAAGLRKAGTDRDAAPGLADTLIAEHLQRPKPFDLAVEDVVLPEDEAFAWPSAGAVLGLTHLGLGRVAAGRGGDVLDAARLLAADLWDTKLDGKGAIGGGMSGLLAWPDETPVDVEDTRYTLALEVAGWAEGAGVVGIDVLNVPGGLLDLIAGDDGPLYPKGVAAFPFDEEPPVVAFVEPTPPEGAWVTGEKLPVTAVAKDKTPLATVTLATEPVASVTSAVDAGVLTASVALGAVPDGALVLRVTAKDSSKHALQAEATRTVSVDRTAPVVDVAGASPGSGAWLSATEAHVVVPVADAGSGVVEVQVVPGCEGCEPVALVFDGGAWRGPLPLVSEGANVYQIDAWDAVGNAAHVPYLLVRDTVPPALTPVKSEVVDPYGLVLTEGTKEEAPSWGEALVKDDLMDLCCLGGGSCSPGTCSKPLIMLTSETACGAHTPVLRFAAKDAADPSVKVLVTLGEDTGGGGEVQLAGPALADLDKAGLHLALVCSGVFGVDFATLAGRSLVLRVVAVDAAGNESPVVVVRFTVALLTPPLWIETLPPTGAPDELLTYSVDTALAHVPFALVAPPGVTDAGYVVARWKVVNPHGVPQVAAVPSISTRRLRRHERHCYLPFEAAATGCSKGQCSYQWDGWDYNGPPVAPGCIAKVPIPVEQVTIPVEHRLWVIPEPGGSAVEAVTWEGEIGANSSVTLEWRVQTHVICAVDVPVKLIGLNGPWIFYPVPNKFSPCNGGPASTPATYAGSGSVSTCSPPSPGAAVKFYNPRVIVGFDVAPGAGVDPTPFAVQHEAPAGGVRLAVAPATSDLLGGAGMGTEGVVPPVEPTF